MLLTRKLSKCSTWVQPVALSVSMLSRGQCPAVCRVKWGTSYMSRHSQTTTATSFVANVADYNQAKPFSEIPGPRGLPYLGTLLQYRKGPFQKFNTDRFQDALLSRYEEYGRIVKETIAGATVVHLFDPEYVKSVFLSEGKMPHIAPLMETTQLYRQQRGLSLGLGNTNGEEWYRLRSAVQQMMMRPKAVTVYLPGVNSVADDFIKRMWKQRDEGSREIPDMLNEVARWNLESAGVTVFETRLGAMDAVLGSETEDMIQANRDMFVLSGRLKFSVPWFKLFTTPTWKKLVQAEECVLRTSQNYLDRTLKKINDLRDGGKLADGQYNFLMYLLSRKELDYKDVCIITLSLFSDGLSTTVPTFLSNLYCMARNPEVQQKVYEEISQVVPRNKPITAEMINKLVYLKACIKEAFRFFPIGLDFARVPQQNMVIGGYQIPAGTHIELNNFVMFQQPEYFKEPEKFLPERWLRGGSAHNIHPYILMPFGHGPRMCAGRRFAEQEMYVLMVKILQNFRLEWHYPDMGQKFQILMVPDCPCGVTFFDR